MSQTSNHAGGNRQTFNLAAAIVTPILLQSGFIVSAHMHGTSVPWFGNFMSQALSAVVGALFIVRQFRWWSIPVLLVYVPLIFIVLVWFSLWWHGEVI